MNVWTPIGEPSTDWESVNAAFEILLEDGGFLLLENGDRFLMEVQPSTAETAWRPFPRFVALISEGGRVLTDDAGKVILTAKSRTAWAPIGD